MYLPSKTSCLVNTFLSVVFLLPTVGGAQQQSIDLQDAVTFLASFDKSFDADQAQGSPGAMTAADVSRSSISDGVNIEGVRIVDQGKFGGSLKFSRKTKQVLCYSVAKNFPYSPKSFDASISFWMKTDLGKLPKGFIDPLQITDKKWNDASIFVDFNQDPRDFRLGVFSDISFWNPNDRDYNKLKPGERPLVDAGVVKFKPDQWHHVVLTFAAINSRSQDSVCELWIDGQSRGKLKRPQRFTWDLDQAKMMLGIYFVGSIDDFAVFDRVLSKSTILAIQKSPKPLSSLITK